MIIFWIAIAGLLCLALGLLLPSLLRRQPAIGTALEPRGNLRVLQDQFRQANEDLASGQLTAEQHRGAVAELERRVLEEGGPQPSSQPGSTRNAPRTALVLSVLFPLLTLGLYAKLGNLNALAPQGQQVSQAAEPEVDLAQLNALVDQLGQRMAGEPNNLEGWTKLARAYTMLQRYDQAKQAFEHALAISVPDAQLLADLADVLAVLQGKNSTGEPEQLIQRALQIDPQNVKALALAGSMAFDRKDFDEAVRHWSAALQLVPAGSEVAQAIESSLAVARGQTNTVSAGAAAVHISGTVRLAPALAGRVSAGDTLYIFARAAEGPRMPLAIVRAPAQGLPVNFILDDSSAMSPQTRLSQFKSVVLGARISKSGQALPQSGDLVGQSGAMGHNSQGVEILIDAVQP